MVDEYDGDISVFRQRRRRGGVRTRIELNRRGRSLRPNRLQRRSGEPDLLQPMRLPFARRHDRVSARRIDLRRTAAGDHSHVRMRTDHSDAANFRSIERKLRALILEKHGALFLDFLRYFEAAYHVHYTFSRWIVDHAGGEHRPQYPMNVIIQFRHRHFARFHRFLQIVSEEDPAWLLMIQAGRRGFLRAVRASPVRKYKPLKVPIFLQDIGEQISVFAGVVAFDAVVGAHHGGDLGVLQSNLKRQQVSLARRPLVDIHIDRVAAALLIVQGIMLDVADDMLSLQTFHDRRNQLSSQYGIFAQIFEGAAIAGFAGEIGAPAERHVVALGAQFTSNQSSVFVSGIEIPARGRGHVRGQRRRVASILATAPNSIRGVRDLKGGNAQAGNANHVSRAAIGLPGQRTHRTQSGHSRSVEQRDLFLQRHFFDYHRCALVWREAGIAPRMILAGGLGEGLR